MGPDWVVFSEDEKPLRKTKKAKKDACNELLVVGSQSWKLRTGGDCTHTDGKKIIRTFGPNGPEKMFILESSC